MSNQVRFDAFCRQMYTECKTSMSFSKWKKNSLASLRSVYADYLLSLVPKKTKKSAPKTARYMHGVEWIAFNDDPGSDKSLSTKAVSEMVSVCLLADLFGKTPNETACDVTDFRKKNMYA